MTQDMTWHQVADGRYEIRDGEVVVAALARAGLSGEKWSAEAGSVRFAVRRTGLRRPQVTVARDSDGAEVAIVRTEGKVRTVVVQGVQGAEPWQWTALADKSGYAFARAESAALTFTRGRGGSAPHGTVVVGASDLAPETRDALHVTGLALLALQQQDGDATLTGSLAAVTAIM